MTAGGVDILQSLSVDHASAAPPLIWGLDALRLHDQYWADHGVTIVRRGSGETSPAARGLFLLLHPHQLALFDIPAGATRLSHRRPLAFRIGLARHDCSAYREIVVADRSNRLTGIRRRYDTAARPETRVAFTRDAALAALWQNCRDPQAAAGAVQRAVGAAKTDSNAIREMHFDARDAEQARRFILALMTRWRRPVTACPELRSHQDDVWVHETALIEPSARLIAPLWIGKGVTVDRDDVVIGPAIIEDHASRETAGSSIPQPAPTLCEPAARISAMQRCTDRGRRLFNIAFALAALLLTAPLFPLIMLAIWLEDGRPFLFPHTRQTIGGRDFVCYKFRTMCRQAERMKAALLRENICDGPQFHISNDPRLLRVGRFLRRFHLDELPQFFNVLMGHMDVVGPRPSPDDENQFCPAWREARLSVRPGMTGLWQVSRTRAPNTDFQEWIRYDLDYVQRRNWRLDLWIVFRTIKSILMRGNRCRGTVLHRARDTEDLQADTLTETPAVEDVASIAGKAGPVREAAREEAHRAAA